MVDRTGKWAGEEKEESVLRKDTMEMCVGDGHAGFAGGQRAKERYRDTHQTIVPRESEEGEKRDPPKARDGTSLQRIALVACHQGANTVHATQVSGATCSAT